MLLEGALGKDVRDGGEGEGVQPHPEYVASCFSDGGGEERKFEGARII